MNSSPPCPLCLDRGTVLTLEFDGWTRRPCPACTPKPNAARAQAARDYGTDRQRRQIADEARRRPFRAPRGMES